MVVQADRPGTETGPLTAVPADCHCSTCTAYRERTAASSRAQPRADDRPHAPRCRPRRSLSTDGFEAWRCRRLPARLAGLVVGLLIAVVDPELTRALAARLGQSRSGAFTDLVRGLVPALAALPLLRLVAYRRRDALLIFVVPLLGLGLLPLIGWRLPVRQHPDWPLRPNHRDVPEPTTSPQSADPSEEPA